MSSQNLYAAVVATGAEHVDILFARPRVRIERIVSTGQASPPGVWFDQPDAEWVAVLTGKATLRFEDAPVPLALTPGDHVFIAAHRRHRVDSTDPMQPTVWLAVHIESGATGVPNDV